MAAPLLNEIRVLILAPTGRDSQLLANSLKAAGMAACICRDLGHLIERLDEGAAVVISAEEALPTQKIELLSHWLSGQEPWSDIPIVVLTSGGRANAASVENANLLRTLGNITLMERPVRRDTLLSAASSALRARMWQYEMRRRQDALTRANMDLEQFAYSASHDLQEPLRNIATYSELIARRYGSSLDDQGREFLGFVRNGAVRMQNLVQDLLVYTQAASITDCVLEPTDAGESLTKALSNLSESIRQTNAEIDAAVLPSVRIRPVHLQQVFQNLIGNALKYRSLEPPCIRITATQVDSQCVFAIKDNGIGISSDHKHRIFGLFTRLHTNEEYPGTGLGLAICKRIVERSNGKIWVESQAGAGSIFFFSLPI